MKIDCPAKQALAISQFLNDKIGYKKASDGALSSKSSFMYILGKKPYNGATPQEEQVLNALKLQFLNLSPITVQEYADEGVKQAKWIAGLGSAETEFEINIIKSAQTISADNFGATKVDTADISFICFFPSFYMSNFKEKVWTEDEIEQLIDETPDNTPITVEGKLVRSYSNYFTFYNAGKSVLYVIRQLKNTDQLINGENYQIIGKVVDFKLNKGTPVFRIKAKSVYKLDND